MITLDRSRTREGLTSASVVADDVLFERVYMRRSFRAFIEGAWPIIEPTTPFVDGFHIDAIAEHLQAVTRGEIRDLLINMPPRFAKSTLCSVMWPAWVWTEAPSSRFLTGSYAGPLALRDAVRTRRLIQSPWYQERWGHVFKMTSDQNVKSRYENDKTGYRIATSVDGSATGDGGDFVLVDDPHNVREAHSKTIRQATLEWWDQVMGTRLNNPKKSARVIIQQRVHQNDVAGHVLEAGGWEHLNLPMEYEPTTHVTSIGWRDPRTEPGQFLSPERFGPEEAAKKKRELGEAGYAGQYQQRPSPAEGGTFKQRWWKFWQYEGQNLEPVRGRLPDGSWYECPVSVKPHTMDQHAQSWDMSFRETTSGSFVVGQTWARREMKFYLIDQFRNRCDFVTAQKAVKDVTALHPLAVMKLIENKANGPAIVSSLNNEIGGMIEIEPYGSKTARAEAVSPLVEAGDVFLPHPVNAPWIHDLIKECAEFPNGTDDDQVDALSQMLHRWSTTVAVVAEPSANVRPSMWGGGYEDDDV